jgi:hypothetical protein
MGYASQMIASYTRASRPPNNQHCTKQDVELLQTNTSGEKTQWWCPKQGLSGPHKMMEQEEEREGDTKASLQNFWPRISIMMLMSAESAARLCDNALLTIMGWPPARTATGWGGGF